jgi:hypothetical protein
MYFSSDAGRSWIKMNKWRYSAIEYCMSISILSVSLRQRFTRHSFAPDVRSSASQRVMMTGSHHEQLHQQQQQQQQRHRVLSQYTICSSLFGLYIG